MSVFSFYVIARCITDDDGVPIKYDFDVTKAIDFMRAASHYTELDARFNIRNPALERHSQAVERYDTKAEAERRANALRGLDTEEVTKWLEWGTGHAGA